MITLVAGSTYAAFVKQVSELLSPLTLLFLSQGLVALFTILTFGLLPTIRHLARIPHQTLGSLLVVSLLGGALGPILWFTGMDFTSAVNASLFGKLEMFFVLALAWVFLHERFTHAHAVSISLIICGLLVILLGDVGSQGFQFQLGDLLVILSALVYAIASTIFRLKLQHIPVHTVVFSRAVAGLLSFFLLSPFVELNFVMDFQRFPLGFLPSLIGMVFVGQFVALFAFYEALDRLPVSTVSLFLSLEIVSGALFAHWYLGEPFGIHQMIGGGLIVLGTIALELMQIRSRSGEQHLELRVVQQQAALS